MRERRQAPTRTSQFKRKNNVNEKVILRGKVDYIILLTVIMLVLFGVIMIFSASYYSAKNEFNDIFYYFKRQFAWSVIGFFAMIFVSNIDYKLFKNFSLHFYLISILFLIIVLIPGIGIEKNGARRWLQFGPIGFQPSEVAKVALCLYLPRYIIKNKGILKTWMGFFRCCIVIMIPAGLIAIENASTAIVLSVIGFSILFVATPRLVYFVLPIIGAMGAVCAMIFGGGFRAARIQAWLDPFSEEHAINKGFQTVQSLLAIASGGLFGLGFGESRQKLGFIPEGHNDIIFAIICEELGVVGAGLLVILFSVLIWRGYNTAMKATNSYNSYVATGITTMITVQVIMNIAVVSNTIPNTGIPLPFISYGGTSLLIMMSSVGVLLSISRYFTDVSQ